MRIPLRFDASGQQRWLIEKALPDGVLRLRETSTLADRSAKIQDGSRGPALRLVGSVVAQLWVTMGPLPEDA
ncbi:hypothetical protein C8Q79DRAFT_786984 [Trametes meyenii]|nr:hypothetical protein C8Q79DRAFT_786984 [Trametes meyenii]